MGEIDKNIDQNILFYVCFDTEPRPDKYNKM